MTPETGQAVSPGWKVPFALSILAAVLTAISSFAGLVFPEMLYPTQAVRNSFVSNDVVTLGLGVPVLLGSMILAHKRQLIGSLFWPGALLYITYNYIAYAVALPAGWQRALSLALVILSIYAAYLLVSRLDKGAIQQKLSSKVHERLAGGVLAGFGLLFFAMRAGVVVQALAGRGQVTPEVAVAVADLTIMPLWIAGGISLWRKQPLGYACGAGLLFQGSMLFIGLLVFFILQPILTDLSFPTGDFIAVAVMGSLVFIPLGLFTSAVLRS